MAQGAPVVSTAELGTKSILGNDAGAIVVAEKVDEFAAAVVRVLNTPALRERLSAQGRAHARSWSSLAMARKVADVYRTLRASRGAPAARAAQQPDPR